MAACTPLYISVITSAAHLGSLKFLAKRYLRVCIAISRTHNKQHTPADVAARVFRRLWRLCFGFAAEQRSDSASERALHRRRNENSTRSSAQTFFILASSVGSRVGTYNQNSWRKCATVMPAHTNQISERAQDKRAHVSGSHSRKSERTLQEGSSLA